MSLIILSIFSFLLSFIPFFNLLSFVVGIVVMVIGIIGIRKTKEKTNKQVYIISSIISIFSIIISVVVFYPYIPSYVKEVNSLYGEKSYIYNNFLNYKEYDMSEEINVEDNLKFKINDVSNSNNEITVNVDIKYLKDNSKFSIYNFYIYDKQNNKVYFPEYSSDDDFIVSETTQKDTQKNCNIKFCIENYDEDDELYFIYKENGGIKVRI